MPEVAASAPEKGHARLSLEQFEALLMALRNEGWQLVGPTVRDEALVHEGISGVKDLPRGWTEVQEAGRYRLARREDEALFGYSVGPKSWKHLLFVPRLRLMSAHRQEEGFRVESEPSAPPRLALIGARSCDLHAIAVQDRTFLEGPYRDPDYAARRERLFVVAVNCGQAGGTCFCVSMRTGPRVTFGFDIALTELLEGEHRFLAEAGSERGAALLARLGAGAASEEDLRTADAVVERTAQRMGRTMDTTDIKGLLYRNLEHPRWDDVAQRCLACTNCTLVCPTCFCSTVEDTSDLRGEVAERWRRWDSCFTLEHSHLHGGNVRQSIRSRYRQWHTHKLASWWDQFGTSGCIGCGRCITWCPVGIDITEEVAAIRAADGARSSA
ncbi:4Fe-4S dicluster domain-containing protein [Hyalangium minutum]|uniref:Ferredoxin n=1 Tax=Hyalangium minutum TaxID=394096 RepID=A0A085WH99_9BACT|nr:4Fe-4S dicluster domain-containing protein [Hyalangium minutum]KFE67062.1 Ferredoxin [Hyalangium minutum]